MRNPHILFDVFDLGLGESNINVSEALESSPVLRRATIKFLRWSSAITLTLTLLVSQNLFLTSLPTPIAIYLVSLPVSITALIAWNWMGDAYIRLPSYNTNKYLRKYFTWRHGLDTLGNQLHAFTFFIIWMLLLIPLMCMMVVT